MTNEEMAARLDKKAARERLEAFNEPSAVIESERHLQADTYAAGAAALREVERLRGGVERLVKYAEQTFRYWDGDKDAKVGKRLMWMAGMSPGYEPQFDWIHSISTPAPDPRDTRIAELQLECEKRSSEVCESSRVLTQTVNAGVEMELVIAAKDARIAELEAALRDSRREMLNILKLRWFQWYDERRHGLLIEKEIRKLIARISAALKEAGDG